MISKKIRWDWLSAAIISLLMFNAPALAEDLNHRVRPAPTMDILDQIPNTAVPHNLASSVGANMKTLDQIPPTWDQILPASERFKLVMGGAAVMDKETGLVWEQSPGTGTYTWTNAQYQCNDKALGGRKGWRLPMIQELASFVDTSVSGVPKLPSGNPFSNVNSSMSSNYWSSTSYANNTTIAWYVSFASGNVHNDSKNSEAYVLCVRGGQGTDAQ